MALGSSRPRSGGGRKHDLLLTWALKALHHGQKPKDVKATMKKMSRKKVAEIAQWVKAENAKMDEN